MSTSILNLLLWFPWLNFYSESFFLQLLIVVTFYYFISSTNLFYASFTLFTFILLLSIFLAYYNLEVLTGFLLVIEFTAFFIILLFLLSMNFESLIKSNVFSFYFLITNFNKFNFSKYFKNIHQGKTWYCSSRCNKTSSLWVDSRIDSRSNTCY